MDYRIMKRKEFHNMTWADIDKILLGYGIRVTHIGFEKTCLFIMELEKKCTS
jgi:hypothetical protein